MPAYIDPYTIQFLGMERDELEYARDRYRRSARERRRAWRRLWLRNRMAILLAAIVFFGALDLLAWAFVRGLGTGTLLTVGATAVSLAVLYPLARSRTMRDLAKRWAGDEQEAREVYQMDADAAEYAAQLCVDRWPGKH